MSRHPVRRAVLFGGFVIVSIFAIIIILALAGVVPKEWALESAASICAVLVGVFLVFIAHLAGHEIMEAVDRPRFSPVRLSIGIALAFALVSLFEILL